MNWYMTKCGKEHVSIKFPPIFLGYFTHKTKIAEIQNLEKDKIVPRYHDTMKIVLKILQYLNDIMNTSGNCFQIIRNG